MVVLGDVLCFRSGVLWCTSALSRYPSCSRSRIMSIQYKAELSG